MVAGNANRLQKVAERRPGAGWLDRLLHPAEPGFDAGSLVRAVVVHYPKRSTPILSLDIPWWLTFIVVSMLARWPGAGGSESVFNKWQEFRI